MDVRNFLTAIRGRWRTPWGSPTRLKGRWSAPNWSWARTYLTALGLTTLAVLMQWGQAQWLGHAFPRLSLYAAVMLSAWVGGARPAIMSMVVGYLADTALTPTPRSAWASIGSVAWWDLGTYYLFCGLMMVLGRGLRRAQQRADHQARCLSDLMNVAPMAVWTAHDPQCLRISGNREALALLGLDDNEPHCWASGEAGRYKILRNGRELAADQDPLRAAARWGQPVLNTELEIVVAGRPQSTLLISAVPVFDRAGHVSGAMAVGQDISDRRRADATQALLAAIVESCGDAIISKSVDGLVTSWNATAQRLLGYTAEQMIGQSINLIIPQERRHEEGVILERLRNGERIQHFETVRQTREGRLIDVSLCISPIRDAQGKIVGASKVLRDITARKAMERAHRQAEQRLTAVLSGIHDHLVSYDHDWRYTYVNEGAQRILGKSCDELLGQRIWDVFPQAVGNQYYLDLHLAVSERKVVRSRHYYAPFDRWFENHIYPSDDGVTVFSSDITEEVKAQEAARKAEDLLRLIVDNLPVLISYIDTDYRYQLNNKAYESWYGMSCAEITGKPIWEVMSAQAWETVRPHVEAALAGCMVRYEADFDLRGAGHRSVEATYVPHIDAEQRVQGLAVLVHDVGLRRRAEEELRHSEEAQRLLVSLQDVIWASRDVAQIEWEVVSRVGRHFGASRCTYAEVDVGEQTFSIGRDYTDGARSMAGRHRVEDWGPASAAQLKAGRTLAIEDVYSDPRLVAAVDVSVFERWGARAVLCVPLAQEGKLVALLSLHHSQARVWSSYDIQLMEQVAQRAWIATESARANAALRKSRDVLSLAMRGGRMGAWSRDISSDVVWWSRELEDIFGLSPGSFGGTDQGFYDLVHPDDRVAVAAAVEQALLSGHDYAIEFKFRHSSGQWRWMEGRGRAIYEASGAPVMLYGLGIDITERKEAQGVLRRQAAIFEHQSDAIIVTDLSGQILDYNPAGERMLGYSAAEVLGRPTTLFLRPQDAEHLTRAALGAIEREGTWRGEITFVRKDGSLGVSDTVIKPLSDGDGRVIGAVGVSRDVSERKNAEDVLRRLNHELSVADRRKDEFLATLAHELRNPLAPIRNALEVMRLKNLSDPELRWSRDAIDRQVRQMTRLVDDLLEVSRITQGKLELRRERVELAAMMQSAVEAARPLIQSLAHELSVTLPREPIYLSADPTRLTQIVLNLLNNAAKYTPRGGHIWLSAERMGQEAVLTVRDTGIGIASEHLADIFQMFSQLTPALDRTQGGLGIGLALVHGLVELHGGTVEALSCGSGQGSEFVVRLPVAEPAQVEPDPEPTDSPPAMPQCRVLVVDDNRDAADSLAMMMELLGHQVRTAYDGAAAMQQAAEFKPDVAVLDIGLPKLNGYEVARYIRAQSWGAEMVLVAITGWGQLRDKQRAVQAGFDHHFTKPVDPADLEALLQQHGTPVGPSHS